ncbi:HipA N-terminal domain-containing protein [bacterium]|nr:HipA N-terminal domain-containing protein [bacterium]
MSRFRRGTVFLRIKNGCDLGAEAGYEFVYDKEFLENPDSHTVSLPLPLKREACFSKTLFPFFDGLIPDGWLQIQGFL